MVEREGREAPCQTADIPLGMPARPTRISSRPTGLADGDPAGRLARAARFRYGHAARNVLDVAAERPELAAPIVAGPPRPAGRGGVAARLEQARSVADVLLRRTRLGDRWPRPELRTPRPRTPSPRRWRAELGWGARRVARGRGLGRGGAGRGDRPRGLSPAGRVACSRPPDILPPPWRRAHTTSISRSSTRPPPSSGCRGTACFAATSWSARHRAATAGGTSPESREAACPGGRAARRSERTEPNREREPSSEAERQRTGGRACSRSCPSVLASSGSEGLEASDGDIYISASQIRRCELRAGRPGLGAGSRAASRRAPPRPRPRRAGQRRRAGGERAERFDDLTPVPPTAPAWLSDRDAPTSSLRAVDLLAPLALGQRVLVGAAPALRPHDAACARWRARSRAGEPSS